MNLKNYYQKLRATELSLPEPFLVLVSRDTPDGGKPGVRTEVPRLVAAKMIIEGWARVATDEEAQAFREEAIEAKRLVDREAAVNRMQVTVVAASEPKSPKNTRTPKE